MNTHQQDLYYEQAASRSPGSQRHPPGQTLHRQPSRQFDVYGQMPNSAYSATEDQAPRYDSNRFERVNTSFQGGGVGGYGFDVGASQSWNPNAFAGANTFNAFGAIGGRMKPPQRGRTNLPPTWLDPPAQQMPNMNGFGAMGPPPSQMENHQTQQPHQNHQNLQSHQPHQNHQNHQMRSHNYAAEPDEELIPTAIVIKNIPFAVKKEQLVDVMNELALPLPYAFNYHFDNGVFRGLAFANFTSPEETATVIGALNHYELQGRKLRVEYKKMLPLQERERIEREKRERRGQLEEQHRPMNPPSLQNQHSMSSLSSQHHIPASSPSPVSSRTVKPDVDLNDPQNLAFYNQLFSFKEDLNREALIFPSTLTPTQRRIVHTLAHHMQLQHISRGNGEQRQVHVFRSPQGSSISPPMPQVPGFHMDASRRVLNRAATTDFSEARNDPNMYGTLRGQQSGGLLGVPDSPGGFASREGLRAAKSFADLRSYTPSPVPSSASFPAALQTHAARLQDAAAASGAVATPSLTPTASGSLGQHPEDMLVNGFGNISIGSNIAAPNGGSPRRLRGMFSWEGIQGAPTAPIGSNRNFGGMSNYNDPSRERNNMPIRQPSGPERGAAFSRTRQNGHQTRGSDEIRHSQPEIIVE